MHRIDVAACDEGRKQAEKTTLQQLQQPPDDPRLAPAAAPEGRDRRGLFGGLIGGFGGREGGAWECACRSRATKKTYRHSSDGLQPAPGARANDVVGDESSWR